MRKYKRVSRQARVLENMELPVRATWRVPGGLDPAAASRLYTEETTFLLRATLLEAVANCDMAAAVTAAVGLVGRRIAGVGDKISQPNVYLYRCWRKHRAALLVQLGCARKVWVDATGNIMEKDHEQT